MGKVIRTTAKGFRIANRAWSHDCSNDCHKNMSFGPRKVLESFFGHTIVKTKPSVNNNDCPLLKQCNILFTKNLQFFKALYFPSFCILFYFFIFILKMLLLTPRPHFPLYTVLLDLSDRSSSRKLVSLISFLLKPHCLLFVDVVNSIRFNITSIRMIHFQFFYVQFSSGIIRLERRTLRKSLFCLVFFLAVRLRVVPHLSSGII